MECPCPSRYGDSIAAVKFSHTPSCMILMLVARIPAARLRPATLHEVGDLVEAELAVPPERADHVGDQVAARDRIEVRRPGVGHPRVGAHDRVLPGRDAQREEIFLALEQPRGVLRRRQLGEEHGHAVHGTLVQRALRAAVREPLDPAVRRVGGLGGDPRELERPRVGPGAVVVAVVEQDRPVRDHCVEVGRRGRASRERRHRPAAAGDPRPVVPGGVRADHREVLLAGAALGQVALHPLQAPLDRVAVGVGEARRRPARRPGRRRRRRLVEGLESSRA